MNVKKDFENTVYQKKYREIYKLIFDANINSISDHSNWMMPDNNKSYVEIKRPLWIILESKIINKRLWVCHEWGEFKLSTAQLDLPCDSYEYSNSFKHYSFKTQKDLCKKLKEVLEPCLEREKENEEDLEYDR